MIVTCYAHLISMARIIKKPVPAMSNLADNNMDHLIYLPKTLLNALLVTATK
jgi:hypothetical protein